MFTDSELQVSAVVLGEVPSLYRWCGSYLCPSVSQSPEAPGSHCLRQPKYCQENYLHSPASATNVKRASILKSQHLILLCLDEE